MGVRPQGAQHRFFTMRNPFARCVFLAVALLLFVALTWRTDGIGEVRDQINKAKETVSHHGQSSPQSPPQQPPQQPISEGDKANSKSSTDKPAGGKGGQSSAPAVVTTNHVMNCDIKPDEMQALRDKYNLAPQFDYFKRYLKIDRQFIPRKSITKLDQNFVTTPFYRVDLYKNDLIKEKCPAPLTVPVTQSGTPATGNLSDFMFGVSTTFKRFNESKTSPVNEWTFWLTDGKGNSNGGKLVLLLLDATEDQLVHTKSVLNKVGIDVDVYHSDSSMEMAVRYLTLVPTLYNHPARPNKKWLVVCDDDTYFPSVHQLKATFEAHNSSEPLYVGTLSEDVNNIDRHGSQAFGGAGVFISMPLAEIITNKYDTCKTDQKIAESNSGWGPQGDILLRKCIYENSEVRLTVQNDLWQLDLYGDPSGFYEGGNKPLSLHHFKGGGWHTAFPWQYSKIAHICGEDCTLQRYQTNDDFIISNGFSVAQYPQGIDFNLKQLERTFAAAPLDKGWNLDYMFGPQRPPLYKTGRKISWDGMEAVVNPDNTVTQTYVRHFNDWRWTMPDGEPMTEIDGIIELVWLP